MDHNEAEIYGIALLNEYKYDLEKGDSDKAYNGFIERFIGYVELYYDMGLYAGRNEAT